MQHSDADTPRVASVSTSADEFVLQLALAKRALTADQLATARETASRHQDTALPPPRLLDILQAQGALDQPTIAKLLAEASGVEFIDLTRAHPSPAALALVPQTLAQRHRAVALALDDSRLHIATADPLDTDALDTLSHVTGKEILPFAATPAAVSQALERAYGIDPAISREPDGTSLSVEIQPRNSLPPPHPASAPATTDSETAEIDDTGAPVVQLVQSIIAAAVQRRASDIHLEPLARRFRVRYRIDGALVEADNPPKRLQLAVISRLKIMANISIAEKRIPQDGRIRAVVGGRALDLRVSSLPTAHGESIVMRLLDPESLQLGMPELGFAADDHAAFQRLIAQPDGMILVTGPTGSGKTTTLYSCLHHLNRSDRKIITVEDPIEYQFAGINQVPVRPEIGMTFASALRAMLRQAPNVVMVGEIRDRETAEIAINASLTGHMVFSTLHTNDAPGAVTRLVDLGVRPFLVATSLRAAMAQRLVRKICETCRAPHPPNASELASISLTRDQIAAASFARGIGCAACNGTGYRGRTGIFEILEIDDELQRMIHTGASPARLRAYARSRGMRTMREDGLRKASAGLTTIEEVVSITTRDAS